MLWNRCRAGLYRDEDGIEEARLKCVAGIDNDRDICSKPVLGVDLVVADRLYVVYAPSWRATGGTGGAGT